MAKRNWTAVGVGAAAVGAGLALFSQFIGRRAEAQVPADGKFIDIEGARLHYLDIGEGPAIVLIHGLGGQLRNFSYALTDRLPGHRLILIDRPRSGYSTVAGDEPGLKAQADFIAAAIRKLGLERPLLVGHSLGGAISLSLALDHPGLVSALALIAPLTQPQTEVPAAFKGLAAGGTSKVARGAIANLVAVPVGALTGKATTKAVFAPEPVPDDFAIKGGGLLAMRPGNVYAAMFELQAAGAEMTAIAARYGELQLPVSILYAREDNLLDYRRHGEQTVGEIAGARLELTDGGHMLPITQPELTASFIGRARAAG
ncbi:MAG: alpha/beta hydrolase [Sphingomonas bacterium]|uniref:alpha/beta fold hydrolase n=1 Tax=Sphingomonas bacterium TaxID=1895847 RepID=UPI00262B097D|nr:alpha/beta hydrolase [Sphingomonas bacterium]MDB5696301.1 alpha/beta hydrolase [Sphingomonas bacterium]